MSVCARVFCHWLSKFIIVHKKTPDQDDFCKNELPSSLPGEVSQAHQDGFCDNEYHDFLQLMQLLSTLHHIDHVANVKKLLLRRAAILRGSILENILHSGERKDPRTLILIWD